MVEVNKNNNFGSDVKPFLSVVIPIYNAAHYIKTCLDSILSQRAEINYEVICVNDGSNDDSDIVLEEYVNKHANIRVVRQPNGGVSSARRKGVELSNGEWITFVDADDTLPPDTFVEYTKACTDDYDIIIGEFIEIKHASIIPIELYRERIIKGSISSAPWAKVFRKSLFDKSSLNIPRDICYGEDLLMNVRLSFRTNNPVNSIGKIVYNYIPPAASAAHSFKKTPEYEERFSELLLNSIPKSFRSDFRYLHSVVSNKLNGWRTLNFLKLSTKKNRDTLFYNNLVRVIEETNYPLSWQDKIQVYGKSIPIRLVTIYLNLYPVLKYKLKCLRKHVGF